MRKVYAICLFLLASNIFASDNLIVTANFFKGGGGHVHLTLLKIESKTITKAYPMNVWGGDFGRQYSTAQVLSGDWGAHKRVSFRFTGDYSKLANAWEEQYRKKLVPPNYWYNNCADDVLDSLAFVFKVQSKGLRKFWRVARFILPIANIVPTLPIFSYYEAKKSLNRNKNFTKLSDKEMREIGL
jgi:hypothetical protein